MFCNIAVEVFHAFLGQGHGGGMGCVGGTGDSDAVGSGGQGRVPFYTRGAGKVPLYFVRGRAGFGSGPASGRTGARIPVRTTLYAMQSRSVHLSIAVCLS